MTDKFNEWAKSLSGCDGGNEDAKVWISGIEWGYGKGKSQSEEDYQKSTLNYYKVTLPDEISKGKFSHGTNYDWMQHITYPFGVSVAKLYAGINGIQISNYKKYVKDLNGSELFKMNLYPIAFRNINASLWDTYGLKSITGFDSKETYRLWCFLNRFPAISEYVNQKSPDLIICIGLSFLYDFFLCFAGSNSNINIFEEKIFPNSSDERRYYWALSSNKKTLIFVIPFFSSQSGLNSDKLLEEMAKIISEKRNKHKVI